MAPAPRSSSRGDIGQPCGGENARAACQGPAACARTSGQEGKATGGGDSRPGAHQRQVHEHLHPVARAHVGHVVEVGWVGNHFGPQFWVSKHLPGEKSFGGSRVRNPLGSQARPAPRPALAHRRCCSLSSSGTLKTKRRLLRVRSICFLLLSEVSGTLSAAPAGRTRVYPGARGAGRGDGRRGRGSPETLLLK